METEEQKGNSVEQVEDLKQIVTLKRPLKIDDEEITKLKLNFDKLSGADILKIDKELRAQGMLFDDLWNQQVILKLASRATGVIEDDLLRLHPGDYLELTIRTRNFFIRW